MSAVQETRVEQGVIELEKEEKRGREILRENERAKNVKAGKNKIK